MKLFLMRHAHADYGPPDPERTLSGRGQECAQQMASFAMERGFFDFEEIWCSPYERARQTAEPFLNNSKGTLKIHYMDKLVPHGDPADLYKRLKKQESSVLIVGHNPHLSILASALIGIDRERSYLPFKKGALMVLKREEFTQSGFCLQAYLTPSSLGL
ncbi:phosphohistidine phosphatase SixA [Puniceicoccales bacterium CK1056]|uniref:Phosphohistidine phosphatase SixA n=1 Tax=Oceanipulchritudo coccoides TaxID=2706888 RepID=A0A6B2LY47_9BACT|nr:phosphohistidine phosphatase SixA [Oceanipulchritudo coccoides]NDV60979.1 phosphohistidine phosphatase SixA [Oceanipulchritudo coccoides]